MMYYDEFQKLQKEKEAIEAKESNSRIRFKHQIGQLAEDYGLQHCSLDDIKQAFQKLAYQSTQK